MTTAASSQHTPTRLTSKNYALRATHGVTRWHSILQGCRKSEHSRFSRSYSLQRGRRQHFNRIASGEWCRATPPEGIIPRRAKCQLLLHLQLICENFSQLRNMMNARTALGQYRSCIDVFASGATRHKFRGDAAARTGGIPIIGSCKVATSGNRTLSDFGTFL